jgi:hypothetical protein
MSNLSSDEKESSHKCGKHKAMSKDKLTWHCEVATNLIIHKAGDCLEYREYALHYFLDLMGQEHSLINVIRMCESNITS